MLLRPATRLERQAQATGKPAAGPTLQQVDVVCVLCGEVCGFVEATLAAPLAASFHVSGADQSSPHSVETMRCRRCGGTVLPGERRVIRPREETVDWRAERPRRGRPPKWLLELREREIAS